MYLLFGVFLAVCVLFFCFRLYRRKCTICLVRQMGQCKKVCLLNQLLEPFGFCYQECEDIVSCKVDAWQRRFGYCSQFDHTALRFGMVFDCEPIYFYCGGHTYRIELWKGQYGITVGAEAGIYYTDGHLKPEDVDGACFRSVADDGMLKMELALYYKGRKLFEHEGQHWWLTGFCLGRYCEPEDLMLRFSVTFTDSKMLCAFVESLMHMGYQKSSLIVCDMTVSFSFYGTHTKQPRVVRRCRASWAQFRNRLFVKIFICVTRPFTCTLDRVLFLYFFLPRTFRRIFLCKRNRRQKFKKKRGRLQ